MESTTTQELSLNCIISAENKLKKMMRSYIIVTLFHGCSSKSDKYEAQLDAKGNAMLHLMNVNVEFDYLRFQVFIHRKLLSDKHVGDVNVLVSDLVLAGGQPSSAAYKLGKASEKGKKVDLKVSYKLSNNVGKDMQTVVSSDEKPVVESKRLVAAIGNDIALFKTLPSFRTPFVSFAWN